MNRMAPFPTAFRTPFCREPAGHGDAVVAAGAQMGVAWDGDFDRCFLFDDKGRFVRANTSLGCWPRFSCRKSRRHDHSRPARHLEHARLVESSGGTAVQARTGHAFLKQALRDTGAVYGGEMSAHHYFREFMACDSGMIPWLLVAELIGRSGKSLAELVSDRIAAFPSSGEITSSVPTRPPRSRGSRRRLRARRRPGTRWMA